MASVTVVLALSLLCAGSVQAAPAQPATPQERARVVRLTQELEADPFSADAPKVRGYLMKWIEDAPDLTVQVCDLIGMKANGDEDNFFPVFGQMLFANAAFQLEHPEAIKDQVAVQSAAVRGALKAYANVRKVKPQWHHDRLDELSKQLDTGKFDAAMRQLVAEKCK